MNSGMMTSTTPELETPQEFFDRLNEEFRFVTDVCASDVNRKCPYYWTKEDDGLSKPWAEMGNIGPFWMNPPYGLGIKKWVQKAYEESQKGALVVCLLPARTDTQWFHKYCKQGEIRFIEGRLRFLGAKNSAPFPSMVVIFRPPSPKPDFSEYATKSLGRWELLKRACGKKEIVK